MPQLSVHLLKSTTEVLGVRAAWNDLWARSTTARPTARAEFLPLWCEKFAPNRKFRAIVVEEGGRFLAALPCVGKSCAKVLQVGSLPRNEWLITGNLLLDETHRPDESLPLLAQTMNRMGWPAFRLSLIPSHESAWRRLRPVLGDAGLTVESRYSFSVPLIEIQSDWPTYVRQWSKNHRKNLARVERRLEEQGGHAVRFVQPRDPAAVATALQLAFEIEDASWKGKEGSSVLRQPGLASMLVRLSELLAERGELEVAFLELAGRAVAFEILWNSKGVMHSYKVGYAESLESFMPGQILMQGILKNLFETQRCQAYDCFGPVSVASGKWTSNLYHKDQWTIATRNPLARALLLGYRQWTARRPVPIHRLDDSATESNQAAASRQNGGEPASSSSESP